MILMFEGKKFVCSFVMKSRAVTNDDVNRFWGGLAELRQKAEVLFFVERGSREKFCATSSDLKCSV